MKSIKYTIGIFALLVTFSSCTVEELESANNSQNTMTALTSTTDLAKEGDIDPPILPTKP